MKPTGRAAVAQWTKRLTRNGQTRVRIREAHIFDITLEQPTNFIIILSNIKFDISDHKRAKNINLFKK